VNRRGFFHPAFVTAVLVMSLCAVGMKTAIDRYNIYLQKKPIYAEDGRLLRAIPAETANWRRVGHDHIEPAETAELLGTDNYITRVYTQKEAAAGDRPRRLQLHAAYYTGMIDTVPHVPERCLVGGGMALVGGPWVVDIPMDSSGWLPLGDAEADLQGRVFTARLSNEYSTAGGGRRIVLPFDLTPAKPLSLRISRYSTPGGEHSHFAGYFFVANGGWVSSAEGVRQLAFDLRNDYAYYLKVQVGSNDVESPEELAALAGQLLDDLLGELMTCVPDWVKVQRGAWPPDNPRGQTSSAPGS
jgi:hypothetical protein